jgi:coenzyme F420-reducing hydrogenase beta subunit
MLVSGAEGFPYPQVDLLQCTECGLCQRVCPVIGATTIHGEPVAYACSAIDDAVRMTSSSGGVFALLAENVIDDGGVVFGAAFDEDFSVVHEHIETRAGLARLQGSKYVQSRVDIAYAQAEAFLKQGRRVLFTGTPCQVAGLRSFMRGERHPSLLCADFVCHGVPSPRVWERYVTSREEHFGAELIDVSFRDKTEGWRRFSVLLKFDNGTQYCETLAQDPFMRAFLTDICLRPSCYACRFKGLSRESDITLADFWGIEHVLPAMDDDRGTSLVLVNSEPGRAALDDVRGHMDCEKVAAESAVRYNPAALRSAPRHPEHDAFYRDLDKLPFDLLVRKYCSVTIAQQVRGLSSRVFRRIQTVFR